MIPVVFLSFLNKCGRRVIFSVFLHFEIESKKRPFLAIFALL